MCFFISKKLITRFIKQTKYKNALRYIKRYNRHIFVYKRNNNRKCYLFNTENKCYFIALGQFIVLWGSRAKKNQEKQ